MDGRAEPIPISALQHAVYCLRQAALIHLERLWADNRHTAEGDVLHAVSDKGGTRSGRGVRRVNALALGSVRWNLAGVADLVEFARSAPGQPETALPVEYKRGKPKLHRADEVQLCAQALCLEEMTGQPVPEGALFYATTRRRVRVPIDAELRALTEATIHELAAVLASGETPPPAPQPVPRLFPHRAVPPGHGRTPGSVVAPASGAGCVGRCRPRPRGERTLKKLLNTLYVSTEGMALRKDGENVVVELEGAEKGRVPLHLLSGVVVSGAVLLTPALTAACAAAGITVTLLDRHGRFQARIEGPVSGNVLLRRAQYRAADKPEDIVGAMLIGKIANQRAVIRRALRDYGTEMAGVAAAALEAACGRMAHILRQVEFSSASLDDLRGMEGEAAQRYFSVFDHLIRSPDEALRWTARSRRPPLDPINALLSFLYTLLVHDCRSAAETVGLDPAVGFLHRDRPGRPSLALDLMEELRAPIADRLALSLVNRRQLRAADFVTADSGAVTLTDDARRTVLTAWQERKRTERLHPFLREASPFGLVPWI